jgi:hypothetical protein
VTSLYFNPYISCLRTLRILGLCSVIDKTVNEYEAVGEIKIDRKPK